MALIGGTMVIEPTDTPDYTGGGVQALLGSHSLSQRQWEAFGVFQVLESLEGIHHCRKTRPIWPRDEPIWCRLCRPYLPIHHIFLLSPFTL